MLRINVDNRKSNSPRKVTPIRTITLKPLTRPRIRGQWTTTPENTIHLTKYKKGEYDRAYFGFNGNGGCNHIFAETPFMKKKEYEMFDMGNLYLHVMCQQCGKISRKFNNKDVKHDSPNNVIFYGYLPFISKIPSEK